MMLRDLKWEPRGNSDKDPFKWARIGNTDWWLETRNHREFYIIEVDAHREYQESWGKPSRPYDALEVQCIMEIINDGCNSGSSECVDHHPDAVHLEGT